MKKYYEKYQTDLLLILLMFITFLTWVIGLVNPYLYILIYIYLFISKKEISWYLVVLVFSIPTYYYDKVFLIDYPLTIILFLIVLIKRPLKQIKYGNIGLLLLIYTVYALISVAWSRNPSASLLGVGTLIEGGMGYFIVINSGITIAENDKSTISKIAMYFLLAITLEITYLYLTTDYIAIISEKNVNLSWAKNNYIGFFYCIGIPISLYKYTLRNKTYLFYFLIDIINIIGLILTLSRGAYVGLIVGLLLFIIFNVRIKHLIKVLLPSCLIGTSFFIFEFTRNILKYIISIFPRASFIDDMGRYKLWEIALKNYQESPIIGKGYYSGYFLIGENGVNNWWYHNLFFEVMATLGTIGLFIIIVLLVKILLNTFKPKSSFIISLFAGLIAFLTQSLLDIGFNYWTAGLIFYLVVALSEVYQKEK